ncbi:MAG: DUF4965 domain-containing protein [Planctomycetes bacterium]|nr:DUF4965 domain-containing protein [Planctomycetota bacterium]
MTLAALALSLFVCPQEPVDLRAPSVPLVVHDPYFSIWLPHDLPTDGPTTHWTGREQPLVATVAIDGVPFRALGRAVEHAPSLPWTRTQVTATRTTFSYATDALALELAFVTPSLPQDLDVLSRPLTYVVWTARSRDGAPHRLELAFEVSTLVCVDRPEQAVAATTLDVDGLDIAGAGSVEQQVLGKRGDDLRIDWGHAYLAQAEGLGSVTNEGTTALVARAPLVVPAQGEARHVMLFAYDDFRAIRYFDADLPAYWRRAQDASAATLLRAAAADFEKLDARCRAFDQDLLGLAESLGGPRYAQLIALAYRQALGGNRLCADRAGRPLLFPKENFSNGCIATVDVIYPMAPLFLLLGADLAKAMLVPVLDYGSSSRWRFPFAPHDLGTYPHATGQVYGGGEHDEQNQMPVEESANLLLLVTAIAQREGHAGFAKRWWPALAKWAGYLEQKGFDPESQLCTDDFTGHLAHNVNLSAKAILALAAFGRLCALDGRDEESARWRGVAEGFAARWIEAARDGERTKLAFDKPGTWSQKYNLVWDRILGLGVFPAEVFTRELAAYRGVQNRFGLPLDSRATFTKNDWTLWSACLSGKREDFDALVEPVWRFAHETPDRVPLSDWYDTVSSRKVGFVARPVVGGFFLRFLCDELVWRAWFDRGVRGADDWAPLPLAEVTAIVPASIEDGIEWRYTTNAPPGGWERADFDDAAWSRGEAGFGTTGTPGAHVRTEWNSGAIRLRRSFSLDDDKSADESLRLLLHHDEDAEVWIDGVLAVRVAGYTRDYERFPISAAARAKLTRGEHVLAVHCKQTGGGQYVDAGIVLVRMPR